MQVLQDVEVTEILSNVSTRDKCRLYRILFRFLPHKLYKADFCVRPAMILNYMERRFFELLRDAIKKQSLKLAHST